MGKANGQKHRSSPSQNVGAGERVGSAMFGLSLLRRALKRGPITGALIGAMGASLLYRAVTGHCDYKERLGIQ